MFAEQAASAVDGLDVRRSPQPYFGLFEVKRGLLAGFGLQRLSMMIPAGEALYLALTGDRMSAEQALRCGLVHEVVESDELLNRATEIALLIVANHPLGVEGARAVARDAIERQAAASSTFTAWVRRGVRRPEDSLEGARAFADKRTPRFEG